jgi:hypothetical protein
MKLDVKIGKQSERKVINTMNNRYNIKSPLYNIRRTTLQETLYEMFDKATHTAFFLYLVANVSSIYGLSILVFSND